MSEREQARVELRELQESLIARRDDIPVEHGLAIRDKLAAQVNAIDTLLDDSGQTPVCGACGGTGVAMDGGGAIPGDRPCPSCGGDGLAPAPPEQQGEARACPTCESDDPAFFRALGGRYVWSPNTPGACPDPFHAPAPPEQQEQPLSDTFAELHVEDEAERRRFIEQQGEARLHPSVVEGGSLSPREITRKLAAGWTIEARPPK